jgi:hypothetical protein
MPLLGTSGILNEYEIEVEFEFLKAVSIKMAVFLI